MMDNCYAPQWADFACSPQLSSDSYFEVEHEVHNSRIDLKSELPLPYKEENIEEPLVAETNFEDSLESAEGAHANVVFFVPHDSKNQKETNNDDIKTDKKPLKSNLYYTWDISMTDLASTSKTTSVPQRLKAAAWRKEIRKNTCVKEMKNNIVRKPQQKAQRRQSDLFKSKQPQRKVLTCQYGRRSLLKYRRRSSKFVSMAEAISKFQNETPERFRTTSNKDSKLGPLMKLKRSPLKLTHPVSPTLRCKQRVRHTNVLSQEEREALEVEQMKKHQIKANPVPVNIFKGPPLLKKVPKKLITVTEEFKLTNSKKTRHTIVPGLPEHCDNEQINKNTVSTMSSSSSVSAVRKNDKVQTHKNAIAISRSISASTVKKDSKEQNKNVKPMSRSISASVVRKDSKEQNDKNVKPMSRSTSASTVRKYDKEQTFKNAKSMSHSFSASNITKKEDKGETRKNAAPISRSLSASNVRKTVKEQINKNTALTDRSTNASGVVANIAAKPVLNVLPFSFVARNKEFQQKKEEKLKHLQEQETNKLKAEFHAKPLPKFSKPTNSAKEPVTKKRTVISCPFSFAERDKNLAKKKEELVKKMQENDKKVPVFHANPVPTFKPVVIHGVAKEKNLNRNIATKQLKNFTDQENKQPNIIIGTNETKKKDSTHKKPFKSTNNVDDDEKLKANQKKTASEMNSDKRAKERSELDEKVKKREQEMEAKRQQEEKERMLKEKSERAELRKLADVKATPVPVYKPMVILKSTKMPTSPKDPKWASKNRLKSTLQV
ncbi:uncharacterized protein LOC143221751 [Lasioglossum baleicum]|uniref:uncharacterized protein LOC143221751 n=1 Tax=Lasioglossum baleicum TaxID=434251 RepID=UPI003FCCA8EB